MKGVWEPDEGQSAEVQRQLTEPWARMPRPARLRRAFAVALLFAVAGGAVVSGLSVATGASPGWGVPVGLVLFTALGWYFVSSAAMAPEDAARRRVRWTVPRDEEYKSNRWMG